MDIGSVFWNVMQARLQRPMSHFDFFARPDWLVRHLVPGIMSLAVNRLKKELSVLESKEMQGLKMLEVDTNILHWSALIVPSKRPYNKGAFKVKFDFPTEYPFKPPAVTFLTPIYHPNVESTGKICFAAISPEHWKPSTKIEEVIVELIKLVDEPDPENPTRIEVAEEMKSDKATFQKKAEEHSQKFAEKIP